jgi:hypothetical protein
MMRPGPGLLIRPPLFAEKALRLNLGAQEMDPGILNSRCCPGRGRLGSRPQIEKYEAAQRAMEDEARSKATLQRQVALL